MIHQFLISLGHGKFKGISHPNRTFLKLGFWSSRHSAPWLAPISLFFTKQMSIVIVKTKESCKNVLYWADVIVVFIQAKRLVGLGSW